MIRPDGVHFPSNDAYYHMRRILYGILHYPDVLDYDFYINFPQGARAIWTPLFDASIALLLMPLRGMVPTTDLEIAASLVPPTLGATTVLLCFILFERIIGRRAALIGALVLALLPGHTWYSRFGFIDHHCAVALVGLLLLRGTLGLLVEARADSTPRRLRATLLGIALASALLLWPGMLIHVSLALAGLGTWWLGIDEGNKRSRAGTEIITVLATAFLVVSPFALGQGWAQWSAYSPVVLSRFQPWLFGSATLVCLAATALWRTLPATAASTFRRWRMLLGLSIATLGISLAISASLAEGFLEAFAWMGRSDDFQALVTESQPLLMGRKGLDTLRARTNLTPLFFALPIALPLLWAAAQRDPERRPLAFLLTWSGAFALASLMQSRFVNSAAAPLALVLGLATVRGEQALERWLHARLGRSPLHPGSLRVVATTLPLSLLALAMATPLAFQRPVIERALSRAGSVRLEGPELDAFMMREVAHWIREHTPRTSGWLDASKQPEWGVVAPWDMGHLIGYVARRPTSATNFGDDLGKAIFLQVQDYFLADEAAGARILEALHARVIVVPYYTSFLGAEPAAESSYSALYERDGLGERPFVRHRLVHEFPSTRPEAADRAAFKIYEFVPGARVVGRAPAGESVVAEVAIRTRHGRRFTWRDEVQVDGSGHYMFRLPYGYAATERDVRVEATHRLRCGDEQTELRVGLRAVRRGLTIRGPRLTCRAGSRGGASPPHRSAAAEEEPTEEEPVAGHQAVDGFHPPDQGRQAEQAHPPSGPEREEDLQDRAASRDHHAVLEAHVDHLGAAGAEGLRHPLGLDGLQRNHLERPRIVLPPDPGGGPPSEAAVAVEEHYATRSRAKAARDRRQRNLLRSRHQWMSAGVKRGDSGMPSASRSSNRAT